MVFDGDCAFCRAWIDRWRCWTGRAVEFEPFQTAAARFPRIPLSAFRRAVHLIEPGGRVSSGAEAVLRSLALGAGISWPLWLHDRVPGAGVAAEGIYRLVARHRGVLFRLGLVPRRRSGPRQ